jgi:hypothetical protein
VLFIAAALKTEGRDSPTYIEPQLNGPSLNRNPRLS